MTDQPTFTEQEVDNLIGLYNIIADKAVFQFTVKEACNFSRLIVEFKKHLDKVNDSVMEIRRIIPAPKKVE